MIMEGGDKDMEVDVTMQHDGESIRMESGQFMEDINEHDFEQIPNQEPSLVQETYAPIE
jgi:hypothetical protein